jgi:hypothetical protein
MLSQKEHIHHTLDKYVQNEYGRFEGKEKWVATEAVLSCTFRVALEAKGVIFLEGGITREELYEDPNLKKFIKRIAKPLEAYIKETRKFNAYKLHYFRTAPFPRSQPKNANRRTDKGENLQSIRFANYLREMTLTDRCHATWTKIAHETSSKSFAYGNLMRNMGKMAGVSDFIFTMNGKALWLELKDGDKGKQLKDQQFFEVWCKKTASVYEIALSCEEAIKIVEKHGFCTP